MATTWRRIAALAAALTLAVGVSACSSGGGARSQSGSGGGNAPVGSVGTKRYTVAMVAHAPAGDTFWDKIPFPATNRWPTRCGGERRDAL